MGAEDAPEGKIHQKERLSLEKDSGVSPERFSPKNLEMRTM
jgi:hypothetical protein